MFQRILQKLKGFSRTQWLILAAFLLVLGLTAVYSYRTYQRAAYWREHRDEPISGWMRVGFVSNSYHVPLPVLNRAIGLPPDARDQRPLNMIANDQDRTFDELKADLEKAIEDFRSKEPSPPGDRP